MFIRPLSILILLVLLTSLSSFAAEDKIQNPKAWTIDDVLNQESASGFDISPSGKWVVWVKSGPDQKENQNVTNLYLSSLIDTTQVQLTRGKPRETSPQWSPDGKLIAFLSIRQKEKGQQIWLMNALGGEPYAITDLANGVQSFDWRNDRQIVFTASEDSTYYEQELKEKKDDAIVVGDQEHFYPVRLFQIDVKSKKIERLSDNSDQIAEFALSPNGRWVVTNENQNVHYPYDNRIPPKQFLYDLQETFREEIFVEKNMKPSGFVWTLESDGFYCAQPLASNPDDDYVSVQTLFYFELKSKNYHQVPLEWKWYLGFFGYYMTKESILVSLANGTRNKLAFYKKIGDNWQQTFLTDEFGNNLFIRHMNQKGDLVIFSHSTASTLPQIKLGRIEGNKIADQKEIIKLNDDLKNQICLKYVLLGQEMSIGPAIMPTDPKFEYQAPRMEYVGFRVVIRE